MRVQQILPFWEYKVTYAISVTHNKKYTILSNMSIRKKVENSNNMTCTHFDKSPTMLPQDLIILITTYTNISSFANITFWGKQNTMDHIGFAVNITQEIANFLKSKPQITKVSKVDYVIILDSQYRSFETTGLELIRYYPF